MKGLGKSVLFRYAPNPTYSLYVGSCVIVIPKHIKMMCVNLEKLTHKFCAAFIGFFIWFWSSN